MSKWSSKGKQWEDTRQRVFDRDNRLCVYCLQEGKQTPATHIDHIIPKSVGGNDSMDNLLASCAPHNLRKGARLSTRQTWLNSKYFNAS